MQLNQIPDEPTGAVQRGTLLILPFYKGLDLVHKQHEHLLSLKDELISGRYEIFLVNDYPGDDELDAAIEAIQVDLTAAGLPTIYRRNERNMGFVASTNHGLTQAMKGAQDALLLNSDAHPQPGCLTSLRRVAYLDEKIGFTGPRSNASTISSIPWWAEHRNTDFSTSKTFHDAASKVLPDFQYVPTLAGFCLFIKLSVLLDIGVFDEIYSPGYNEENDLIFRANRIGYRVALVNSALAGHSESSSFSSEKHAHDTRNARVLNSRYPEYKFALEQYATSLDRRYEILASELIRANIDSPRLLVDLRMLKPFHNGTFMLAVNLTKALVRIAEETTSMELGFIATRKAVEFHGLGKSLADHTVFSTPDDIYDPYTISFLPAQPFSWPTIQDHSSLAPINVYLMLDVIAYDCYNLLKPQPELDSIMKFIADHAPALGFISEFSKKEFALRFGEVAARTDFLSYPSLKLSDYDNSTTFTSSSRLRGPTHELLVMGNHYHHKMVDSTAQAIVKNFPGIKVHAFGYRGEVLPGIIPHRAGELTELEVHRLFERSLAVVFPSNYEGFGFPIPQSMALNKPLILRDRQVSREVYDAFMGQAETNAHFFESESDLVYVISTLLDGSGPAQVIKPEWSEDRKHLSQSTNSTPTGWDLQATGLLGEFRKLVENPQPVLGQLRGRLTTLSHMESLSNHKSVRLVQTKAELTTLKEKILDLQTSTSWRATAPLRALSRTIRPSLKVQSPEIDEADEIIPQEMLIKRVIEKHFSSNLPDLDVQIYPKEDLERPRRY